MQAERNAKFQRVNIEEKYISILLSEAEIQQKLNLFGHLLFPTASELRFRGAA